MDMTSKLGKLWYHARGNLLITGIAFLVAVLLSLSLSSMTVFFICLPLCIAAQVLLMRSIDLALQLSLTFVVMVIIIAIPLITDCELIGYHLEKATTRQACENTLAGSFTFKDVKALLPFSTSSFQYYVKNRGTTGFTYKIYLVPLVDGDWKDGDPVHVWAGSGPFTMEYRFHEMLRGNFGATKLILHQNHYTDLKNEIISAAGHFNLISDENPLILGISPDPRARISDDRMNAAMATVGANLTWLFLAAIVGLRRND